MRLFFAITYLVILAIYLASHFIALPLVFSEARVFAEKLALYCYLLSLAVLSVSKIVGSFRTRGENTSSSLMSQNMKAYIYTTRLFVIVVVVGFPLFVYLNWSRSWGVSDSSLIGIPTILLAIAIAEQNIYSHLAGRLDRIGIEQARVAAIFQIVDTMLKDPLRKGIPEQHDLDELEHRLRQWEDRTAEANFAKFAAQAISTMKSIKRNNAEGIWNDFLGILHRDLKAYVAIYT